MSMQDFNQRRKEFDRDFERTRKLAIAFAVVGWTIALGLLGFGVWVILLLLRHFGVL